MDAAQRKSSPPRRADATLAGASVLLLGVYLALGIHGQVVHLGSKPLPEFLMEDYGYYARAFARWQVGQSPYADRVIGTAFIYPPQSLLLVAFFESLGGLASKFAVYATLSLSALLGAVALALRACEVRAGDPRVWVALVLALGFGPVGWCLYLGQVNLLVALCVAAGFFLADERPYVAGAAIAVGAAIKLTPIVLLVLFLQRRYLRVHVAFALTSLVLLIVAGVVFGFDSYLAFVEVARGLKDSYPVGLNGSLSILNGLYLLAGALGLPEDGWHGTVQLVYAATLAGLMLIAAWLTRDGRQRHLFYAQVALSMTVMPNVLWYHHLVFLIAALLTLLCSPQSSSLLRAGAAIAFGVIQLDQLLSPLFDKLTTTPVCLALLLLVFTTIVRFSTRFSPAREPRPGVPRDSRPSAQGFAAE